MILHKGYDYAWLHHLESPNLLQLSIPFSELQLEKHNKVIKNVQEFLQKKFNSDHMTNKPSSELEWSKWANWITLDMIAKQKRILNQSVMNIQFMDQIYNCSHTRRSLSIY